MRNCYKCCHTNGRKRIKNDGDTTIDGCLPGKEIQPFFIVYFIGCLRICYEGGLNEEGRPADTRTQAQRFALLDLLTILKHQYPEAQIIGHYQLSASIHKACPCFDAQKEYFTI